MSENKCETKYPFEKAACYIANRYTNLEDWQEAQREATKRFMNGNLSGQDMEDIKRTIKKVLAKYNKPGDEWVITFIPASTNKRYKKRYEPLK